MTRIAALCCVLLVAGCAQPATQRAIRSDPPLACATEAEGLLNSTQVFASPSLEAEVVGQLESGRLVYLCEKRDGWIGVMFPGSDEHADCSERTEGDACARGWAAEPIETEIYG